VWLDGRAQKEIGLRTATFDRDWEQRSEDAIDTRVCDCCPTAVAVTASGPIVAFRDRTDDETRDIRCRASSDETWTEPVTGSPRWMASQRLSGQRSGVERERA
jgi:hypothetical protein